MKTEQMYALAYVTGVAWLLGWETSAFAIGRPQYTISDMTWTLEGPGWSAARFFIAAALIWLTCHLAVGWFR